ncbi:MAG: glutamate--tRNA ligase [Deltaproteobacteria bacterium RIFOXYA12_FULL_61_11]|nr:MAG: glutamate--tRNA ligase [Deltaproteobacteria bacterium RIFOXYA12_FULL_61_11]
MEARSCQRVRTRVAPSPTGDPHVGTVYQALFNYAFAKHHGGDFLLRIEDTDQTRSSRASETAIFEALRWAGLAWDEGPDVGGPCAPYRQSERTAIYREHCARLLESGAAYRCYCTPERLTALRLEQQQAKQTTRYDGYCRDLTEQERRRFEVAGTPYVVRLRVPDEGVCQFPDLLRGVVELAWDSIDDQVLLKSDGFPTYHLANVVDDHLMDISHVIRGEEWINSGPKHLLLYKAFDWTPPIFCHLPLLRNPDRSKLSKRHNPTSVTYYRRLGILPEAFTNYLGLMGWTMPDERELFSIHEMAQAFDLSRISLGGPIFDEAKLRWLNGKYLREKLDEAEVLRRLRLWCFSDEYLAAIVPLVKTRMDTLAEFVPLADYLFTDVVAPDRSLLVLGERDEEGMKEVLHLLLHALDTVRGWDRELAQAVVRGVAERQGIEFRAILRFLFPVLAGRKDALPLFETMEILGKDLVRRRLRNGLEVLGGPLGNKKLRKLLSTVTEDGVERQD